MWRIQSTNSLLGCTRFVQPGARNPRSWSASGFTSLDSDHSTVFCLFFFPLWHWYTVDTGTVDACCMCFCKASYWHKCWQLYSGVVSIISQNSQIICILHIHSTPLYILLICSSSASDSFPVGIVHHLYLCGGLLRLLPCLLQWRRGFILCNSYTVLCYCNTSGTVSNTWRVY